MPKKDKYGNKAKESNKVYVRYVDPDTGEDIYPTE